MPKAKSEPDQLGSVLPDARRVASFRDKTSSPRLERTDRQNSSPPEGLNIPPRKEDEEDGAEAQNTPKKRLQRVEILKIVDSTPMIEPSQVHVNQATVLMADPVVTPFEKLRQKDEEVSRILEEKQKIISDILHIPEDEFDMIADLAGSTTGETKEAREILLAALSQAKSLTQYVNSSLRIGEEEVVRGGSPGREPMAKGPVLGPQGDQLVQITTSMNQHLTDLLAVMQERDNERDMMRRQLAKSNDQIREFFRFTFRHIFHCVDMLLQVRLCPLLPLSTVRLPAKLLHIPGKRRRRAALLHQTPLPPLSHRVRLHPGRRTQRRQPSHPVLLLLDGHKPDTHLLLPTPPTPTQPPLLSHSGPPGATDTGKPRPPVLPHPHLPQQATSPREDHGGDHRTSHARDSVRGHSPDTCPSADECIRVATTKLQQLGALPDVEPLRARRNKYSTFDRRKGGPGGLPERRTVPGNLR